MKWGKDSIRGLSFLGACADAGAPNVLLGAPMDYSASFRPGSRFGPEAIRHASCNLEEYSLRLEKSLEEVRFFDAGDLLLPFGNVTGSLALIEKAVEQILAGDQRPFVLGGDHLVSLPCLRACARRFPGLKLVHIDAHADLRDQYMGEHLSHATVVRQALDTLNLGGVWQFAVRSATREEHDYARKHTKFYPFELVRPLRQAAADLTGPVYVTVDIDAVDPAFAPGTGTPESGGITPAELLEGLAILGECQIVGFDLVEVAPAYDGAGITAALAAKIVREALIIFGRQP